MKQDIVDRIRHGVRRGLMQTTERAGELPDLTEEDGFNLIAERIVKQVCLSLV